MKTAEAIVDPDVPYHVSRYKDLNSTSLCRKKDAVGWPNPTETGKLCCYIPRYEKSLQKGWISWLVLLLLSISLPQVGHCRVISSTQAKTKKRKQRLLL